MAQQFSAPNFKPKSEWKHEGEASFLSVYLPGYAVEKLTVTPNYANGTVKIEGNRRLPNNKLLPVDETFNVPQQCDLSKMDKQFEPGKLTLKFPTSIVVSQQQTPKQTSEEEPVADYSMTDQPLKQTSITTGFDEQSPDKSTNEVQISVMRVAKTNDEEKLAYDANGSEAKPGSPADEAAESDKGKSVDDGSGRAVAKPEESPKAENLGQNNGVGMKFEEGSKEQRSKESSTARHSAINAAKSKEKRKQRKWDSSSKGKLESKNGNEDKKMIVNMALAILIVMGLAISLLYTLSVFLAGISFQARKSV